MYATKQSTTDFEPCPAGMHQAVCYRVLDLGVQVTEYQGQTKKQRKMLVSWELPEVMMEPYEYDGKEYPARPFTMHKKYTFSFHEKATLLKDLNSWRGRPFTDAELAGPPNGFHMRNILGANCFLNIIHNVSEQNGKTYANIAAVAPLAKGMVKQEPTNDVVMLDMTDASTFDADVFEGLSDNLKETIKKAPEYAYATGQQQDDNRGGVTNAGNLEGPADNFDLDDEIPF